MIERLAKDASLDMTGVNNQIRQQSDIARCLRDENDKLQVGFTLLHCLRYLGYFIVLFE